jgi:hypothetical protein
MSDCSNAEVRDLLPDLMHDRLDAHTRARVVAHVDGCADCRSELELLRSLRGSLDRGTPHVDVNRIVAALPTPASVRPSQHRRAWRVLSDWRIAAAVTFIVAGGTSVVVMRNVRDGGGDSASAPAVRQVSKAAGESTASESTANVPAPATGIAVRSPAPNATTASVSGRPRPESASPALVGQRSTESVAPMDEPKDQSAGLADSRIGDLNAKQLKSLLNAIEHMDATPITEPEPVTLRVGARTSSPTGLRE